MGRVRLCSIMVIAAISLLAVPGVASALSWSGPTQLTNPVTQPALNAVTCISPTQCVAVGAGALEATFNPTSLGGASAKPLSTTGLNGVPNLQAVFCPTASQCTAVGDQGDVMTFNPSTRAIIKNRNITGAGTGFYDVACVSTSLCVAGDDAGYMFRFVPGTGVASKRVFDPTTAQFNGIACATSTQCTAVDQIGIEYTFDPTPSPLPVPKHSTLTSNADPLQGIACVAADKCIAGDQKGNTQTFDPASGKSTLQTNPIDPGTQLFGMSCPTTTFCGTIDVDGNAYEGAPGKGAFNHDKLPGMPFSIDSIACASTILCVAADNLGELYVGRGAAWALQTTPNPTGSKGSNLDGVSCLSATACTAVGYFQGTVERTLAEHWNGASWTLQTTPNPVGTTGSYLSGAACPSATACIAVGHYLNGTGKRLTLAEKWNGASWALQTSLNPTGSKGSNLAGVSCVSATACIAVGDYQTTTERTLAEHWNGASWTLQTTPNPVGAKASYLSGVSCTSATVCTAVGHYVNSTGKSVTLAEKWNGSTWVVQTTANPTGAAGSSLGAVSCPSATACTAVGNWAGSGGTQLTLAEKWNGASWLLQTTPNPAGAFGSFLTGVSCTSATACLAVGNSADTAGFQTTLAEIWNGASWQVQTSPNPGQSDGSVLGAISCRALTPCVAVGTWLNVAAADLQMTLAERYS
jgi:hypothetical protein